MTSKTNSITTKAALSIGVGLGIVISVLAFLVFSPSHDMAETSGNDTKGADEPLYWVAPMDPNFKRDKPGKSPMGMDLVPVYEENSAYDSLGTISIDPVTIQNLGVKTSIVKSIKPKGTIQAVGQVQYAQNAIEHVHPRIEGWVETLSVRTQGDFIEKGEALYSIYSPELVNAQEEFVIALNQQNAALINAAKARLRALAVPQSRVESIEKFRKISQTVTVLAPATGFIDALNVQQGMYVTPGMTMLSIASLDTVWVIADVFPNDASLLSIGQRASISSTDLPGQVFEANLDFIYPMLNSETRTVQARFVVDNQANDLSGKVSYSLKPNMYTLVELFYGDNESDEVLTVPKQAIIRTGKSDRVVLAMQEGKYKSVNVRLGRDFGDVFEILNGVVEGDAIVTSAQFLIDSESSITSDFMRMTPVENTIDADASAWTEAVVVEVELDRRRVTLTHGYLDAFDMMGMTMGFTVASDINIDDFVVGDTVHVEIIRKDNGMFQVKTLHITGSSMEHQEAKREGKEGHE